ncbi:MAG TPA: peptide MFS transporter [Bacteroidales bacterium]|nr:peptide MFS transporter [Bacteroidales bacterium]HPT02085.1 peptide MFS transporter [Bacteroidales bacterium]
MKLLYTKNQLLMFKQHPKGLIVLAIANMGERFGYYTMLAILTLYMQAKFGLTSSTTSIIYGSFLALVYFLPLFGGIIADKVLGYGKTILLGIGVMFTGYLLLAAPSEPNTGGYIMMFSALALIAMGTGLFKGNLQALVGNLYEADIYKNKRDIAFSIFYMFINIGAFFAPSAANSINKAILAQEHFTYDASVPKNYVKLNDKVVDRTVFLEDIFKNNTKALATHKDSVQVIEKAKKKQAVIFQEDKDKALFNLKSAGLYQLTNAGLLKDSNSLSLQEYRMLESKRPEDAATKNAIIDKINKISITDPKLYGDSSNPELFASNFGKAYVVKSLTKSYNWAFALACISLIISVSVFLGFRKTWKSVDKTHKQQLKEAKLSGNNADVVVLTPKQVKERVIALLLVFFVVIFFWMSFHQNGLCLTFFARDYTTSMISPVQNMMFSLLALLPFILFTYGIYQATIGLFGGEKKPLTGIILSAAGLAGLLLYYFIVVKDAIGLVPITPQIFQQFNPLFIVLLTPVSVALFAFLGKKGKEPSAPKKIGFGMLIAALGFIVMIIASMGLPAPSDLQGVSNVLVNPGWLIGTYFVLTIAELFLSPMGLSFVAKVAPPQYKGMMQGGWLAATAIGNYLVGVLGMFWEKLPLYAFWSVLVICCLLSASFIFSIMKRLEKATE